MSQSEFDQYLALLSGLLRLNASQRDAIASELRDHLEERLAELLGEGVSRHKAIETALEEFGDATGLAGEFVQIFRKQRRRWMMRMTLGTAISLAAVVMLTLAFWPHQRTGSSLSQVLAQDDAESRPANPARLAPTLDDSDRQADAALRERIEFDFVEMPLNDVMASICSQVDLQFHIKMRHLEDLGVSGDAPVSLSLTQVSVEMGLDLLLEQLDLTYIIRDGVVLVTTEEDLDNVEEVRIYNCRDLLTDRMIPGDFGSGGMGEGEYEGGSGVDAAATEKATKKRKRRPTEKGSAAPAAKQSNVPIVSRHVLAQFGGFGGGGGGMVQQQAPRPSSREERLMDIIMTAIVPDSWEPVGGPGTIAEFDGLIVIRHNPRIHRQVELVLKMLREASEKQPWPAEQESSNAPAGGGGFF